MWPVADKYIRASLDHRACKHVQEFRRQVTPPVVFMRVDRHDREIGDATRIVDDRGNLLHVVLVGFHADHVLVADREVAAEYLHLAGLLLVGAPRVAVHVDELAERLAGLAQRLELAFRHHVRGLIAQGIEAWPGRHVISRAARTHVIRKAR